MVELELLSPGCENEISKYARPVRISGTCGAQNRRQMSRYCAIDPIHLLYRRLVATPDKNVTERGKQPQQRTFMNVDLCSVQVAERFIYPTL